MTEVAPKPVEAAAESSAGTPAADAAFAAAVAAVLAHEGGFQAMPDDPGNWTGGRLGAGVLKGTNFGISAASYPALDIVHLTAENAAAIYRRDWWDRHGIGRVPPPLAAKLLDAAVNLGIVSAVRCLQRALRAASTDSVGAVSLADDGKLGPKTLAIAAALPADQVLPAFREALAGTYRLTAARNATQARFLTGWLRRAYS